MSPGQYSYVEQDLKQPASGNELPTYDDLVNQNGPNSRFGRWRGWIEKRAAERYADITPEERARRRARGWGNEDDFQSPKPPKPQEVVDPVQSEPVDPHKLHIETSRLTIQDHSPYSEEDVSAISLRFVSELIEPSHLKINHFGSRFLPHATSQIRCVLPLLRDRLLLVGHDDGLSVLDMFPQDCAENGDIITSGPGDAHCWPIWTGETVYQMSLLEAEDNGSGTPQGVVLAIVGLSQDAVNLEAPRTARMYNLASLISLARCTISQKGTKPLDLSTISPLHIQNSPSRRHRQQGSIARSIKSLTQTQAPYAEPTSSYQNFLNSPSSMNFRRSVSPFEPENHTAPDWRDSTDSGWDVVDDVSLKWATDFVPLAPAGSRLAGIPVLCFATWCDETRKGKGTGGQLLAVASKNSIVLYETPKGERAYRFVKEFYTPLQPRNLAFVHQSLDDGYRSSIEAGRLYNHKRSNSNNSSTLKGLVNNASSSTPLRYGTHLSLFVVFDKKAGIIRLADSAVDEIDLGDDGGSPTPGGSGSNLLHPTSSFASSTTASLRRQRARLSFEIRESASKWIVPVRCELPVAGFPVEQGITEPVHILTRGNRTHVVPCPLPIRCSLYSPLYAVFWKSHPKQVAARAIVAEGDLQADSTTLQLIAFSDNGIEIHETGLGFMRKGKGRAVPEEVVQAEEDLGDTGYLGAGGNWDRLEQVVAQGPSMQSASSSIYSLDSTDSSDLVAQIQREQGMYGWYRKDTEDWRIFWLGGR